MKKKYQALFDVSFSVSIDVEANSPTEAEELFEEMIEDGAMDVINRGNVMSEDVTYESSLEPIREEDVIGEDEADEE